MPIDGIWVLRAGKRGIWRGVVRAGESAAAARAGEIGAPTSPRESPSVPRADSERGKGKQKAKRAAAGLRRQGLAAPTPSTSTDPTPSSTSRRSSVPLLLRPPLHLPVRPVCSHVPLPVSSTLLFCLCLDILCSAACGRMLCSV
uniref:Uncharacterized protein n=1 Tax=Setaria italica TaxID=4555 RepID=K4AGD6_SETIT